MKKLNYIRFLLGTLSALMLFASSISYTPNTISLEANYSGHLIVKKAKSANKAATQLPFEEQENEEEDGLKKIQHSLFLPPAFTPLLFGVNKFVSNSSFSPLCCFKVTVSAVPLYLFNRILRI